MDSCEVARPSIFCTACPTQVCREPSASPRGLVAHGEDLHGWGNKPITDNICTPTQAPISTITDNLEIAYNCPGVRNPQSMGEKWESKSLIPERQRK